VTIAENLVQAFVEITYFHIGTNIIDVAEGMLSFYRDGMFR
jgi:hypothetical protein